MPEGATRNRHFAEQLVHWRADAYLTQRQIAEHVGVTQQTVSDWERGIGLPHNTRLPALAALRISRGWGRGEGGEEVPVGPAGVEQDA